MRLAGSIYSHEDELGESLLNLAASAIFIKCISTDNCSTDYSFVITNAKQSNNGQTKQIEEDFPASDEI